MSDKRKTQEPEEPQAERFKRTAREHDVELDKKKLAETLRRMAKREKPADAQERQPKDKSGQSGD